MCHLLNELLNIERTTKTSLAVQWLRPYVPAAGGKGWIPGWGTKIRSLPHAMRWWQKNKEIKKE